MTRKFEVSFTVETDDDGFKSTIDGMSLIAFQMPVGNGPSVRVPKDAKIVSVVRHGYWRNKASGAVYYISDKTPTTEDMIVRNPQHWEPVVVLPEEGDSNE